MGRPLRAATGGIVYHVLNRANARLPIFEKPGDFEGFERVLGDAHARLPIRILAYCLMPNHWHLVIWPYRDGDLSQFMAWVTLTHTQRWHAHHQSAGSGHLYQGRFKSFPAQTDKHFLTVCRYVERNALRAGLVARAEAWRWSSLWHLVHGNPASPSWLSTWPIKRPWNWVDLVNEPQSTVELESLRHCAQRGQPFGSKGWVRRTAEALRLNCTLTPRGRPRVSRFAREKVPDTFSSDTFSSIVRGPSK